MENTQPEGEVREFIVDRATDETMRLHLDRFEGPLEVLLYLIKSQEIDIFDIPISIITDQYLAFIELMHEENLEVAGDYLVLAATLIQIKSKMLIPDDIDEDDEEIDEEDPRLELVEKLIAYRKYRDVAARLSTLEEERANWYTRNVKPKIEAVDDDNEYLEVSLYDLIQAFKTSIRYLAEDVSHVVEGENCSVDEKIEHLQRMLDVNESIAWTDIFKECANRIELVCSFLAILELCRMGAIRAHQHTTYGDIRVFKAVAASSAA